MTARQEILEVARSLTGRGLAPFSPQQVIDELRRQGTRYPESTIRTHIVSAMCVDAPDNHGVNYADLRRVGRGRYVLASEVGSRAHQRERSVPSAPDRR
jgi:hypothetical protein